MSMASAIVDALIGMFGKSGRGRSVKRKREVNLRYYLKCIEPVKSTYLYLDDVNYKKLFRNRRRI